MRYRWAHERTFAGLPEGGLTNWRASEIASEGFDDGARFSRDTEVERKIKSKFD